MDTIRLQNMVPNAYIDDSRDFQLLCRLYDSIFNGIKFDTDTIKYINDSQLIRSNLLPLLQTKLGFFTTKQLDDRSLRYVLSVFSELVHYKGSLLAIKKLLNMCLKLNNIAGSYTINYSDTDTIVNGISVSAHTIIIGIDSIISNTDMLSELARYILPAGFGFYIYFYKNLAELQDLYMNDDVKLLYSSSNLSAQIRGTREYLASEDESQYIDYTMPISAEPLSYDLLGGVDVAWINSVDSIISDKFKGIFESENDLPSDDLSTGDLAIAMGTSESSTELFPEVYYYNNSQWNKLRFLGNCELSNSVPNISSSQNYDVACVPSGTAYYRYNGSIWSECNYLGIFSSTEDVQSASLGDLISTYESQTAYKYYTGSAWIDLDYKATYSYKDQISNSYEQLNNLVILTGGDYYLKLGGTWTNYTGAIYMLKKSFIENEES